jgi:hypothetical protein
MMIRIAMGRPRRHPTSRSRSSSTTGPQLLPERVKTARSLLIALVVGASLAAPACGGESAETEVEDVLERYLEAVGNGDGEAACELLTPEAQLGVFDFRLVHEGADHPDQACARIVERNRLRGDEELESVDVSSVEVDGGVATASVSGVVAELELVADEWKIARFGLAESVVPGDRPPPKPRPTTFS